jgi:hypothetical protein
MDTHTKKSIEVATARFIRKARKRINKRECAKLGRRYGADIHWKYLGKDGDNLAKRLPGDFERSWKESRYADSVANAFKRERREPHRYGTHGTETTRRLAYLFCWYGPSHGQWPGDKYVFATNRGEGLSDGWIVACASDCPCGKCYRGEVRVIAEAA